MMYPVVGLGLVDVVDVGEHDFEASDITEAIPNQLLLKNLIQNSAWLTLSTSIIMTWAPLTYLRLSRDIL